MEPILEVKNVSRQFPAGDKSHFFAVENISFSMEPGEILGIVGESGSGKSTLARLLTGLIPPTSGQILLRGTNIAGNRGVISDTVQMVFQDPAGSFDPRRTLGDGIGEGLRNLGLRRADTRTEVIRLLERCGLPAEFAHRYPHEVSGGQCQRAAIARALARKPKLLVLDEATSALDVTVQQQILELLQQLHREQQISYLFICHNLALVQQFCHRVLVMYDGRVVEAGTPDDVICNPQSNYTRLLVDAAF